MCFSLLPRTEAVHPLPHSHVLTFQCSHFTNTLRKLVRAHLPIPSVWTCWQCTSAHSCLWLLSVCRLFILCIKSPAVFKKWERRCPPKCGALCVSQKTSISIVSKTCLPFPCFRSFFHPCHPAFLASGEEYSSSRVWREQESFFPFLLPSSQDFPHL